MSLLVAVRAAWRALVTHPTRSLLTMLGIVIGVAAVITMVAVGTGAQQRVSQQIQALGSNLITVSPGSRTATGARLGSGATNTLTEDDAAALAREVPGVRAASPLSRTNVQAIAMNAN